MKKEYLFKFLVLVVLSFAMVLFNHFLGFETFVALCFTAIFYFQFTKDIES